MSHVSVDPPELQYAQPVPWQQRRTLRRVIAYLAFITAIAIGVAIYPWTEQRIKMRHLYARCRAHSVPASAPVYEPNASRVKQLLKDPAYTSEFGRSVAVRIPREWALLYSEISPPGLKSYGTAFLHELRSPN